MISEKTRGDLDLALRRQDLRTASAIAAKAVGSGESDPRLLSLAALERQQAGDMAAACDLYQRAAWLAPDDAHILTSAADALRYTGQVQDAIALFDRALEIDPEMVAAWYGRALALDASGAIEQARESYRQVSELAPTASAGFAGMASMDAVLGRHEAARDNATRAERVGLSDPGSVAALARCDIALKDHASAAARLTRIVERSRADSLDRVVSLGLLGDALDRLGRHDEAFAAYEEANQVYARLHARQPGDEGPLRTVETIDRAVQELVLPAFFQKTRGATTPETGHVFLLGFPRSGNTLVEQILATIPDVVTLEEAPTLVGGVDYLSADGIARLAAASDEELERLRADYWARVAANGAKVAGKCFVDMDPLKGPALPLIARLFPEARVVVIRRDPRDVVWSCFRHNFVSSAVAAQFTSLEGTAAYYAATMRLIGHCVDKFRMPAFDLSYEELVEDFDGTTRGLCDFLGLPWSPRLQHFDETARARPVKTASSRQVQRRLYNGAGQWRPYAERLVPVLDVLRPWIRHP